MATGPGDAPRWSLDSIYPALSGGPFDEALAALVEEITTIGSLLDDHAARAANPGSWVKHLIDHFDTAGELYEETESFAYARFSVKTDDEEATKALNRASEAAVPVAGLEARFRAALTELPPIETLVLQEPALADYAYIIGEERFFATRQLPSDQEALAADLNRAGGDAWSRLHESISSQLDAVWDEASGERRTVVELRQLAYDRDREVRRKAWALELAAWKRVETPLSYAINGVKGFSHTLNSRRGWESTLARSTRQSRLTQPALDALISTMRAALPLFRRYLKAKARALGLEQLSFYDIFAPVGGTGRTWTFVEAIGFIADQLRQFDPDVGTFVEEALSRSWIDAQPRAGKVGGAYCIDFPIAGESRILANFDGTYDGLSTLAHELGHAWHSYVLRGLPASQAQYPMTLAETASIFFETLVFHRAVDAVERDDQVYILEQYLQGATQVIVDILSRYDFERTVMERRASGELSPRELSEAMLAAQAGTYGDAINPEERHQYMWAVKGHYYRPEFAFYNFPYAFGQLFGLGLYGTYESDPTGFPAAYRALLRETGRRGAVEVAAQAGFDIESGSFWQSAIDRIETLVTRFESLV